MSRVREIQEELKSVLNGRGLGILSSLLPVIIFFAAYPSLGVNLALLVSMLTGGVFSIFQLLKREKLIYSFGGIGGVVLAGLFVKLSGSESGFFLPGLMSGAIMIGLSIFSIAFKRPLVAWSSFITRRWPLDWYWHPSVLPAYNEATLMWAAAFLVRFGLELWFYLQEDVSALGASRVFLGWPYTILLLVVSYLYGQWRLGQLSGPSVEEFKSKSEPPWEGQRRGF
jgi:hypothetical protein